MPYFFGRRDGDRVTIDGADAAHLARSLRTRPGETIAVLDTAGRLLTVRVEVVSAERVFGLVIDEVEHRPEPRLQLTLALAMLPAAALELVLSRCTELGVARFVLVQAERSVARGSKLERWTRICREAAMLAGRFVVPAVEGPVSLREAWAAAENPILLDRQAAQRLHDVKAAGALTVFVGPEGGWSPAELELAGEHTRSLGPRNLKAETASMAAVALALGTAGDL